MRKRSKRVSLQSTYWIEQEGRLQQGVPLSWYRDYFGYYSSHLLVVPGRLSRTTQVLFVWICHYTFRGATLLNLGKRGMILPENPKLRLL